MKNIRKGLFETNSSSVHSLCIYKNHGDYPENIVFRRDHFSWGPEIRKDITSRCSYLYECLLSIEDTNKREGYFTQLEDFLKSRGILYKYDDDLDPYPCIDHSEECISVIEELFDSPILLENFLFSDKSYLIIDNDNGYERIRIPDNRDYTVIRK